MKKAICILLSTSLLLSVGATALATNDANKTNEEKVIYVADTLGMSYDFVCTLPSDLVNEYYDKITQSDSFVVNHEYIVEAEYEDNANPDYLITLTPEEYDAYQNNKMHLLDGDYQDKADFSDFGKVVTLYTKSNGVGTAYVQLEFNDSKKLDSGCRGILGIGLQRGSPIAGSETGRIGWYSGGRAHQTYFTSNQYESSMDSMNAQFYLKYDSNATKRYMLMQYDFELYTANQYENIYSVAAVETIRGTMNSINRTGDISTLISSMPSLGVKFINRVMNFKI